MLSFQLIYQLIASHLPLYQVLLYSNDFGVSCIEIFMYYKKREHEAYWSELTALKMEMVDG